MPNTIAAVETSFTMADPRTGKPCHGVSHHRSNMSNQRRTLKDGSKSPSPIMRRKADALGLHVAAGILNPINGVGRCSACYGVGTLAMTSDDVAGDLTLELAHDIPQSQGGAVCWCSVTLQHRMCNLAMSDEVSLAEYALHCDARAYAVSGGHWSPWRGTRWAYDYDAFVASHPNATADAASWRALTPLAYAIRQRAMRG